MKKIFIITVLIALAIVGFSQENIQQPTAINTWTYVADPGTELPFNKNITLQYDERGNLSYYYHVINYPSAGYYTSKRFTYDALNRLTFKHESFQEASYWWSYKYYYTYDNSSNLLECLVEFSDRYMQYYTDEYAINSKDVYQYENGKKIRWDHYTDSTLVLQYYYLYEYSNYDAWSSETKYNANHQPVTKTEYSYSDTQELLSRATFTWSEETETWCNSSFTEYEYNDGALVEKRITNWSNGEISQHKKQIYYYNENGNCTQILFQTLVDSVYVDKNRALYLYDENGLCTNANAERRPDTTWVMGGFPPDTYLFFDDIYSDVNNAMGAISGCSRAEVTEYVTTPIHGIEEDGPSTPSTGSGNVGALMVYPNPTDDVLFVETVCTPSLPNHNYRITNVLGQTLMTGTINIGETVHAPSLQEIDISELPVGVYFITMGEQTVKFVVK